ncbi:hypothetical protein FIBSPDRAFT_866207 [Athelia psychrophila]|uniref:Uncharacterized protein n=1 Tax=Athelia psychrophila TaxID=1759441 RepID=A0A166EWN5_9AGAM|nr:hypothetical protein FIBSPDRAFT_866207 [Fibularhizoctonia sp. CBS 109695]
MLPPRARTWLRSPALLAALAMAAAVLAWAETEATLILSGPSATTSSSLRRPSHHA